MTSAKQEEKNLKQIRDLMQQPENKKCCDCGTKGPVYVGSTFGSFICTACSGLHREFNFRVKSVSMGVFKTDEVKFLVEHGNKNVNSKYLAKYSSRDCPEPDPSNLDQVRQFIKQKYVDKRWFSESGASAEVSQPVVRSQHHQSIPKFAATDKVEPLTNILGNNIPPIVVGGRQQSVVKINAASFFDDEPTPSNTSSHSQSNNTPFGNFTATPASASTPFDAFGTSGFASNQSSNAFGTSGFSSAPAVQAKPQAIQPQTQNLFDAFDSSPPKSSNSAPAQSSSNIFDPFGSVPSQPQVSNAQPAKNPSQNLFDAFDSFSVSSPQQPAFDQKPAAPSNSSPFDFAHSQPQSQHSPFEVTPAASASNSSYNPFDFTPSQPTQQPSLSHPSSSPFDAFGSAPQTRSPSNSKPPQPAGSFDFNSDFGSSNTLGVPSSSQPRRPSLTGNFGSDFNSFSSSPQQTKAPSPSKATSGGLFDGFSPNSSPPVQDSHSKPSASSTFGGFDSFGGNFNSNPSNSSFPSSFGGPSPSPNVAIQQQGSFGSSPFGGFPSSPNVAVQQQGSFGSSTPFGGFPPSNNNSGGGLGGFGGMDGGSLFLSPQEPNPLFSEPPPVQETRPKSNSNAFASLVSFGAAAPSKAPVKQSVPMGSPKVNDDVFGKPLEQNPFGISQASHISSVQNQPQSPPQNNNDNPFGFF